MENQAKREMDQLAELKKQIQGVIRQLDHSGYQLVLMYKYLEGMSWQEIGKRLEIASSTARHWNDEALRIIRLPDNPIVIRSGLKPQRDSTLI